LVTTSRLDGRTRVVSSTTATPFDEDEAAVEEIATLDAVDAIEEVAVEDFIPEMGFGFLELLLPPHALKAMIRLIAKP
jgi:hypothetical protein